ncbi:MAG TPA: hypothetical protein VIH99_13885 [Bdellovibrionota bacterium]|jgi:hypothetical protein
MSLVVSLEIQGATQAELKSWGEKLPKAGDLSMKPTKDGLLFWKWKGFEIAGLDRGLKEGMSGKSENWLFNEPTKKALGELLTAFTQVCPRRFSLYACGDGELPKRESELQLTELLEVVAEGSLGNRVKYWVRL